ncbi:Rossmann-like and DUF2520 domain-containing protein [Thiolinea disciformis]|uniref:Rossmann-like and DUF2520 domain-containing protein n=1 Tax=Thiolinea disciformis TaxID=125614 RepID=UPI00037B4151|nr:Rossmann-like and DUF2520 domain-containing protein [Thiolinea disciformis]
MGQSLSKLRLNIIGCGHVGQTLTYLWAKQGSVEVAQVLNTSLASGQTAVEFIGAGQAISSINDMQVADIYLLACPDKALEVCSAALASANLLRENDIVFHCSGAISSEILKSLKVQGALIASVHPVKSFADPMRAIHSFQPTYCGVEGDPVALELLKLLFEGIGGICFALDAKQKTLYHAASVIACNYVVALQSISLRAFNEAGVGQDLALKIIQPMVQETLANLFTLGPAKALTGPIARGDAAVVAKQLAALQAKNGVDAELYRLLGLEALSLAYQRGKTPESYLQQVQQILADKK